jgi:phosphate transport system substrate-binding protein
MSFAKSIRVSITAALVLAIGISGVANATAPSIDPDAAGKIEGSGATFPWNQYKDWFASFTDEHADVASTAASVDQFSTSNSTTALVFGYSGGGSGAGVANFYGANRRTATQMFSGTDGVLSSSERSAIGATDIGADYTVIPMISGPISVVYNLPGLKTTAGSTAVLRLNGETICGIYLGTIKKWNDAKIKALNPSVSNLPSATIQVVGRSDSSGTTYIFASYLGKSAATAQKNCGYHSNFTSSTEANLNDVAGTFAPQKTQPGTYFAAIRTTNGAAAITGKSGNGGIAPYVKATKYAISYVETSYANKYALSQAAVQTKTKLKSGGRTFLRPTTASVNSALAKAAATEDPINPSAAFVQPVYAAGTNSYPIVGYSWMLLYTNWTALNTNVTKAQVQGMVAFLNWALTDGQKSMYLYKGYTALPTPVRTKAIAELHKIKFQGNVVWP